MQILDCVQGSEEWHAARCGIITASCLVYVMSQTEGEVYKSGPRKGQPKVSEARSTYMLKLLGEQLTGEPADAFSNGHTDRGHEWEPIAKQLYTERTGESMTRCGFIINHGVGYSPDGLVGDKGLVEVKTKLPHLHLAVLLSGEVPAEHIDQCQGGLWISEREWCDFICYWPGLPLIVRRVYRDEAYIAKMAQAVEAFYEGMSGLMTKILEAA